MCLTIRFFLKATLRHSTFSNASLFYWRMIHRLQAETLWINIHVALHVPLLLSHPIISLSSGTLSESYWGRSSLLAHNYSFSGERELFGTTCNCTTSLDSFDTCPQGPPWNGAFSFYDFNRSCIKLRAPQSVLLMPRVQRGIWCKSLFHSNGANLHQL